MILTAPFTRHVRRRVLPSLMLLPCLLTACHPRPEPPTITHISTPAATHTPAPTPSLAMRAEPQPAEQEPRRAEPAPTQPPLHERDPLTFLRDTRARCAELDEYAVEFYRQERGGLLAKSLKSEEHMQVKFRAEPLSVLMDILTEDHDFTRVVFVEGRNDDRMRCFWRKGLLPGLPAPVNDYSPSMAVTFGRSSSPITSFGVAGMMDRIVGAIDEAAAKGHAPTVQYVGTARYEKGGRPVHHIQVNYSAESGMERRRIDVMIHPDTLLPAGCYCWLENGDLDAKYLYVEYDLDVDLQDADFPFERPEKQSASAILP